jgi:uncharacterized protein Yka (UPF0111/DUF47 family)
MREIDVTGGSSFFCISQSQYLAAVDLMEKSDEQSQKIMREIEILEHKLDKNQRAALAFYLIDRLLMAD